ncbi:uncharacterized protein LOC142229431 [Haematobia irritans]|uniref:uncharacterized protein LOC142229431 n=1 Tax=Haematobia irritans TaxID=7368 RepID=UPI003F4F4C36
MKDYFQCLYHRRRILAAKLLLILVFIYCAISSTYLPQTHAIPVPRTKASGQRLILHSNVYRERYHQNLLKNHRYHQQRQQQQLYQQQKQILQDFHRYHQKQRQEQQLEQRSSYIAPILRKVHRQQLRHHHLHQRAAPTSTSQIQTRTMNYCENNQILGSLPKQLYMSLDTMKNMMENYLLLLDEPNGYSQKAEEWSKHHLDMRNADNQDTVAFKNEIHQRLHDFFVNLHNFYHLLRSTRGQIRSLPNERDISDSLRQHFDNFLREIEYTKQAAEEVLRNLQIDIPALGENIEYNRHLDSSLKVRDFIVFKEIIEEMEAVHNLLNTLCYAQLK